MGLLPEKKSIPKQKLQDYFVLIFGEPNIGKTRLAAEFPNAMFALTETGTKGISVYSINVAKKAKKQGKHPWQIFTQIQEEFVKGNHNFETFVIDTEDNAYDWCLDYISKQNGVNHPGEKQDFGATWKLVKDEYKRAHDIIQNNGYGLVSISHARFKEIEDMKGRKRDKLVPSVGGSSGRFLIDDSDIVILYDKDKDDNRILRLSSSKDFTAKQRLDFDVDIIPAEGSPKKAYENFEKEFKKAVKKANKTFNITEDMINEHYELLEKEKEQQSFGEVVEEIIALCKEKGLNKKENADMMKEKFNTKTFEGLTYEQATQHLEDLKGD